MIRSISSPTRVAFEVNFIPPSNGTYEIDVCNYRNAAQTSCRN